MSRTARIVVPGVPHHVYLRGNNRRRLFSTTSDRLDWLYCLRLGVDSSDCAIHQLTLMTNHVHMVTTPPAADSLAALVKRACQRYAQLRNEARDNSGKLFEERFHSKVIEDDAHLMTVILYNDANAFHAGLVADPLLDVWSTAPLHAGRDGSRVGGLWTPCGWYTRLGASPRQRAAAYVELMSRYAARPRIDDDLDGDVARPYTRRVQRPDGTCAREVAVRLAEIPERP